VAKDQFKESRERLIRSHNLEKAELFNQLRYLRRVQDSHTHDGVRYELQNDRRVRSTVEDEIVRNGVQLDGVQVRLDCFVHLKLMFYYGCLCYFQQAELQDALRRVEALESDIQKAELLHSQGFLDILRGQASKEMFSTEWMSDDGDNSSTGNDIYSEYVQALMQAQQEQQYLQQQQALDGSKTNESSSRRYHIDNIHKAPPSINEVYHPQRVQQQQQQPVGRKQQRIQSLMNLGRPTTLVPGSFHPPSDHPLGPNSTALTIDSALSNHRRTLLGDSTAAEYPSFSPDRSKSQSQANMASSTPPSSSPAFKNDLLSGRNHPLRLALRSTSEKLSLPVGGNGPFDYKHGYDFGPRSVPLTNPNYRYGNMPPHAADLAVQHHQFERQYSRKPRHGLAQAATSPVAEPLTAAATTQPRGGKSPERERNAFMMHTGSSVQKGKYGGVTTANGIQLSLMRGGSSGWK
jgi:hypothetical protein